MDMQPAKQLLKFNNKNSNTMKKQYFVFGDIICQKIMDGIDKNLKPSHLDGGEIFIWVENETTPAELLRAFAGWGDWQSITEQQYLQLTKEEEEKRYCTECKSEMKSGYVINDGEEYYCKDDCLHKHHTAKEYKAMHGDSENNCVAYWTEWEDETKEQEMTAKTEKIEFDLTSYLETYFEVAQHLTITSNIETSISYRVQESKGVGGLYELAKELTDEFEELHKNDMAEIDYFEEIETFLENKDKN